MKRKEEAKYLDKAWEEMNEYLKAFLETADQEELHKLRVQIKRLKALLILLEETSQHKVLLKHFKQVKKIFKHAGQIREAHVNLQLGEHFNLRNEAFETDQQKIIDDGINNFMQKGHKFLKNIKSAHKQLKKELPKVPDHSITEYYKNLLHQISVNLTVSGFTEDMHTNRKLIKILIYNYKLAKKALNGSLPFNTEYLDKLQSAIGKWHDNVIAAQLFSSPQLDDKPVIAKINRLNAGVKRSIIQLADDFLKKATTIAESVSFS